MARDSRGNEVVTVEDEGPALQNPSQVYESPVLPGEQSNPAGASSPFIFKEATAERRALPGWASDQDEPGAYPQRTEEDRGG